MLACAAFALPFGVSATQIRNARLWRSDDKLRLVFDLSGPVQYKTFSLSTPERLIVDLRGASLSGDFSQLALGNTVIRSIRSGRFGQGDTRIVLDLSGPVQLNSFLLPPQDGQGDRLVLDLKPSAPLNIAEATQARVDKAHPRRDIIVVVDPGHGGKDPGAVHADAAPRLTASGASVYCLSEGGATSATARVMAQRENGADLLGATSLLNLKYKDPMLAGVILDMSMNATIAASLQLGSTVLGSLAAITSLHQKRVEQAGFAVLKSPDVPSILVETGFISNARDSQRLVTARHQQAVADGLFEGLQRYFQKNPPLDSYIAWQQQQKKAQA
jgi:N-acetylmuramoyl-L-alanine amidase